MVIDYSLYLITDRFLVGNKDFYYTVEQALAGGVTLLQIREKNIDSLDFYQTSLKLKAIVEKYQVPLIINDRLDIALAVDADGLHIGQQDLPLEKVRGLLGKEKILGYSASTLTEAVYGEKMGADYLGVGPVFFTGSKADIGEIIGLNGLQEIVEHASIPVVGIGGININNLEAIKKTGAQGVSLISAILSSNDPFQAAKELIEKWQQ